MKSFRSLDYYLLIDSRMIIQSFSPNIPIIWQELYGSMITVGKNLGELLPATIREEFANILIEKLPFGHWVLNQPIHFPNGKTYNLQVTLSQINIGGIPPYTLIRINNTYSYKLGFVNQQRALSKYAYLTSHKLRAPLSNILGISNRIREMSDDDYEPAVIKSLLEDINRQAQSLDQIIFTLNDLITHQNGYAAKSRKLSTDNIQSIVLIDDEPFINRIHQKILNNYWPTIIVHSFIDPTEALIFIKNNPPDLILLDINMPVMNGWQFLNALLYGNLDIDVVMLSSSIDPEEKKKAFSFSNVKQFFNKPLVYDQLGTLLKSE